LQCKHHPEYDPASGEPTTTEEMYPTRPCPYCWQARAKLLGGKLEELDFALERGWVQQLTFAKARKALNLIGNVTSP